MYSIIIDVLDQLDQLDTQTLNYTGNHSHSDSDLELIRDLMDDLRTHSAIFYGNMAASLRDYIRQHGITLSENIYCGFDTEYKNIDLKSNKILSAQ
jgi:hypothetical protein